MINTEITNTDILILLKEAKCDFSSIKDDVTYLVIEGYKELKDKAYSLLNQCDVEINNNYNKITKDIDADLK